MSGELQDQHKETQSSKHTADAKLLAISVADFYDCASSYWILTQFIENSLFPNLSSVFTQKDLQKLFRPVGSECEQWINKYSVTVIFSYLIFFDCILSKKVNQNIICW